MYNKLLVALDGSPLSEGALPYVSDLVRATGSEEVVLLRVVEAGGGQKLFMADSYLKNCASQLVKSASFYKCIEWESVPAPEGAAASSIIQYAEGHGFDLLILSTHGRSGTDRRAMGSVAEKVLRETDIPVFLVPTSGERTLSPPGLKRVLVPLDGSQQAERSLSHVEQFASRSGAAKVTLLHVKPEEQPGSESRADWNAREDVKGDILTYLDLAASLVDADAAVATKVRFGRPAEQIFEQAGESSSDFIAMTSHGWTDAPGSPFGTVAEEVLHSSPVPVLMVPDPVRMLGQKPLQGPLVYRCDYCGRQTYQESISSLDRCSRCHSYLKARGTAHILTG